MLSTVYISFPVEKPANASVVPTLCKTVYPDEPAKDFNSWINYIHTLINEMYDLRPDNYFNDSRDGCNLPQAVRDQERFKREN